MREVRVFASPSGESRLEIRKGWESVGVYLPPACTQSLARGETHWRGDGLSVEITPPPEDGDIWWVRVWTRTISLTLEVREDLPRLFADALAESETS